MTIRSTTGYTTVSGQTHRTRTTTQPAFHTKVRASSFGSSTTLPKDFVAPVTLG